VIRQHREWESDPEAVSGQALTRFCNPGSARLGGDDTGLQKTPIKRSTPQRRVILEEIRKADSHPSADELYERVRRRLPRISLGTVYRNLETLVACGEIRKVGLGGAYMRFDATPTPHYHIRCSICGRVDDIDIPPLCPPDSQVETCTGYRVEGHELEFHGVCAGCATNRDRVDNTAESNLSRTNDV